MSITPLRILVFFLVIDAIVLLVGFGHIAIGSPSTTLEQLTHLEREASIPAWYSSVKFLLLALVFAGLAVSLGSSGRINAVLALAALLFLIMSGDEAAAIHERVQWVHQHRLLPVLMRGADLATTKAWRGVFLAFPRLWCCCLSCWLRRASCAGFTPGRAGF